MRKTLLAAAGLVFVLACEQAPTATDSVGLNAPEIRAAATTSTTNLKVPFAQVRFVPCAAGGAGEDVLIQATLHIVLHTTVSNKGNMTIKTHYQPQGARATGLTTGDTYNGTGVTQQTTTEQADGLPYEFTFANNFGMIGRGGAVNFKIHQTVHMTINNNGVPTATIDNSTTTCR